MGAAYAPSAPGPSRAMNARIISRIGKGVQGKGDKIFFLTGKLAAANGFVRFCLATRHSAATVYKRTRRLWNLLGGTGWSSVSGWVCSNLPFPAFFIIWFGLGALLVGVAMLAAPGIAFSTQILLWTAASVLIPCSGSGVFRKTTARRRSGQANEVLGEIGVLVRAVEPLGSGIGARRSALPEAGHGLRRLACLADEAIAAAERSGCWR